MRGESARPGKRPMRALSAPEKIDAIQRVHEGESKASVARDIGVPESTLRGWCKSEHKIRGMTRNSSTPDSDPHSPASSSGGNMTMSAMSSMTPVTHSSEEEGPLPKRSKIEASASLPTPPSSSYTSENAENEARISNAAGLEYMASLMSSMAAGVRPENSAMLLQQLNLLTGGNSQIARTLLSMPQMQLPPPSSAVGLVENGLQYTRASGSSSNGKRHSTSAIAPTMEARPSRKSLPTAAEAPHGSTAPVPASRRTEGGKRKKEASSSASMASSSASMASCSASTASSSQAEPNYEARGDEALWRWLTQQQQMIGQQTAPLNLGSSQTGSAPPTGSQSPQRGSWFWQWYKQSNPNDSERRSTSKARAVIDNVLCNNNNENLQRSFNEEPGMSVEEAVVHGEKFVQWMERCSEPAVSRVQVIQFKFMLENLKTRKRTGVKKSRK